MNRAERVREAVLRIHDRGEVPTPGRIQRELGDPVTHNINGRDTKVRTETLVELGYNRRVFRDERGYVTGRVSWERP